MCRGAAVIVREQDNVARSLSGSDTTSLDRRYNSTAGASDTTGSTDDSSRATSSPTPPSETTILYYGHSLLFDVSDGQIITASHDPSPRPTYCPRQTKTHTHIMQHESHENALELFYILDC